MGTRRSQIVVDKALQRRIVYSLAYVPAAFLIMTCGGVAFFCLRLAREALEANADLPSLVPLLVTTTCFVVAAVGFTVWSTLRMSHRLIGPLARIRSSLEAARHGVPWQPLTVRRNDYLRPLVDDLNDYFLGAAPPPRPHEPETSRKPTTTASRT